MEEDEKFTNRHGHTVAALKEAVSALPEPDYTTVAPKPARRRRRPAFHVSPLLLKTGLVIALVALLTPMVVGEYVRMTYSRNIDSAKGNVSRLLDGTVSKQSAVDNSSSLSAAAMQLSTIRDSLCPGDFLDNLAKLYPRAKEAYDECAVYKSSVSSLTDLVSVSAQQMAYLEQLQPLLIGVSKPLEDQFAVLSAQQENWLGLVDGLNRLTVPSAFSSAHAALVKEASGIREQWVALVQASNVQDSGAFRAARTKLTDNFTAFHAASSNFSAAVTRSQTSLTAAATALK
jgi:hypothetical protein